MDDKIYVAFTGFARSGKDSFCFEFQRQVEDFSPNLTVSILSFADRIRQEVGAFVQEEFGISAWTEEDSEKEIIRHFLRGYGMSKRTKDNLYFVKKLQKRIDALDNLYSSLNVVLISDLRFAQFDQDELSWFHSKRKNLHIHICRYKKDSDGKLQKIKAPNEDEAANEEKLEDAADLVINLPWEDDLGQFKNVVREKSSQILKENINLFL
jgi:hypothetical protein|tara:strand:+ start:49497 stop:50126 length:630 start_codon:yes stop_codon:yes gene_type:complete